MKRRPEPVAPGLRTALAVCVGCGWLAASIVLLENLSSPAAWPRAALCLAWLVFAPLYAPGVVDRVRHLTHVGPLLYALVWLLQVLPVVLLPTHLGLALAVGAALLALGHLFLASDEDGSVVACLVLAPSTCVAALAYESAPLLLPLVPLSAGTALVALVLLHGRLARGEVRRARPPRESAAELRARGGYAIPLAGSALFVSLVAFLLLDATGLGSNRSPLPALRDATGLPEEPGGADSTADGSDAAENASSGLGGDLTFSQSLRPYGDEIVMLVYPERAPDSPAKPTPLHLRDAVLDHFDARGVSRRDRSAPPRFEDDHDGSPDGWTTVRTAARGARTHVLAIHARPLHVGAAEWTLLFSPHPLLAVSLPTVRYGPDSVFLTPRTFAEPFRYEVVYEERDVSPTRLAGRAARHPDPQYVQVPDDSPAMRAIDARTRATMAGSRSDYERVARLVLHLRTTFEYELEGLGFDGPAALALFLDRGSGFCTAFASASTLMLRTQGLPARVVTGFLAHDWSAEEGAWQVRERDAHAWIEVHFDGVGWVPFDPTPPDRRRRAIAAGAADAEPDGWLARLVYRIQKWAESGTSEVSLGEIGQALLLGASGWLDGPFTFVLLGSALALLGLHFARRRPGDAATREPPLAPRSLGLYRRVMTALAARGHRRAPAQTPREFAAGVHRIEGELCEPLGDIIETFYRERFGNHPLEERDEQLVEGFLDRLEEHSSAHA